MAMYHATATRLKPLVEKANFTPEQLTVINKMMRGCWALRNGKIISGFLELMLPDQMEMVVDTDHPKKIMTRRGEKTIYQMYVINKGDPIPQPKTNLSVGKCEVCKTEPSIAINIEGLEVCGKCGGITEDEEE